MSPAARSGGEVAFHPGLGVLQGLRQVVGQLVEQLLVQLQLLAPSGRRRVDDGGELLAAEVQAGPFDVDVVA